MFEISSITTSGVNALRSRTRLSPSSQQDFENAYMSTFKMDNVDTLAMRLEPIMTELAKAVLTSRPKDIDVFCHAFFARRIRNGDSEHKGTPGRTAYDSSPQNVTDAFASTEDDEFEDDYSGPKANLQLQTNPSDVKTVLTDETEEIVDAGEPLQSAESFGDDMLIASEPERLREALSNISLPDYEENSVEESLIRSMQWKEGEIATNLPPGTILSPEEEIMLKEKMDVAMKDSRLQTLFNVWDIDQNGNIDLMELVVGIHKFEKVTSEGNELKKASDALAGAGDAQKAVLNITEFAKLIVQLSEDLYGKPFQEVADHLLNVARCSSERVALAASRGCDGSDVLRMIQEDEDDVHMLRETVKGMEESVVNSVKKIKTVRKVMFK